MPTSAEWLERADRELQAFDPPELTKAGILFPDNQFEPVVYYPPITMYPPANLEELLARDADPPPQPTAAYVHIPFCANRCVFCHWVFDVNTPPEDIDDYLEVLEQEMRLVNERRGTARIPLSTVLFGGGTPTFVSARQLERILENFMKHFDLSGCRQFSFEAEPSSLLGEEGRIKLRLLKEYGVHRISLGVQSFNDPVLRKMARPHDATQALAAIAAIRQAGLPSISIDLIYGFPGQTLEDWIRSLETAAQSGADAWQLYRLRVNRYGDVQGPIGRLRQSRPDGFPDIETIYRMKMLGMLISETHGFNQHFSRIFARSREHITQFMYDYCCRLTDVIGMGPSAWSNQHRVFTQNTGELRRYKETVRSGRMPVDRGLYREFQVEARRSFITPLKNDRVLKKDFQKRLGRSVAEVFGPELERLAPWRLIAEDEQSYRLTRRGQFFADQTVMQFFQRQYLPFPEVAHPLMP